MASEREEPSTTPASPSLTVDLAVIGFGKGGKTLAATLAKAGKRVAMIEQSAQMYGGTCINIGCVPTKALVYRGEHPELLGDAGGEPADDSARWTAAVGATSELTALLRDKNFAMLDTPDTATVITGFATFVDPHTLLVAAGDDRLTVHADTIVINTGAVPAIPDIPGLRESSRVVTSTELLALPQRPDRLIVLGGGYVGVEFASMQAAFGAEVTLIQRSERILPAEDPDISARITVLLAESGVDVITGAALSGVADGEDATSVSFTRSDGVADSVDGDLVLAALGRRPMTDGLGLDAVGIETDARGAVVVDEHLRTSIPRVFAVGDVNGGPQYTYVSLDDYRIVLDQLTGAGIRSTADRVAVPHVVFTTPPLARVGLNEHQAHATGRALLTATREVEAMATVPRARIVGDTRGVMKAVADAATGEILGVTVLAHDAHEVINTVAVAMRFGATATQLRDGIYTHPSMTEALNDLFGALA
ncbi:FAD-dependent oxidoreductase [Planctomonas sp. JC2975]|uniref:FAD-dependent oxidoreductase n=1 Tax=Planctomonas sp. JC2975 TaxID=2729626 RepID=UPI001473D21E|nr:FAD-dependent oxidoreductase [Planctomonas sp. JC2975]NNC12308.1 FAD-dependent oxidoreductase [Planctomonas sp. JC2975]